MMKPLVMKMNVLRRNDDDTRYNAGNKINLTTNQPSPHPTDCLTSVQVQQQTLMADQQQVDLPAFLHH